MYHLARAACSRKLTRVAKDEKRADVEHCVTQPSRWAHCSHLCISGSSGNSAHHCNRDAVDHHCAAAVQHTYHDCRGVPHSLPLLSSHHPTERSLSDCGVPLRGLLLTSSCKLPMAITSLGPWTWDKFGAIQDTHGYSHCTDPQLFGKS